MKQIMIISLLFNFILGAAFWFQMEYTADLSKDNTLLISHIKENNSHQLQVNTIAIAIMKRSRIHSAMAKHYAGMYIRAGKEYNLDPMLLVRVGGVESAFRRTAVSSKGAIGLQQIMPNYWATGQIPFIKSARDLFDPEKNIYASAFILDHYKQTCGGIEAGVRCYHGGFRAIKRPRAITIQYQRDVLRDYKTTEV